MKRLLDIKNKKVYLESLGCISVRHETDLFAYHLVQHGNRIVNKIEDADYAILTTCGVTKDATDNAFKKIAEMRKKTKKTILVGGCMPRAECYKGNKEDRIFVFSADDIEPVIERHSKCSLHKSFVDAPEPFWIKDIKEKKRIRNGLKEAGNRLAFFFDYTTDGLYFNDEAEPLCKLRISRGCNMNCAYCIIPQTRGPHYTIPSRIVLANFKNATRKGYSRFIIVGENLGHYGIDRKGSPDFLQLLYKLYEINPGAKIAIRYLEPVHIAKFFDGIEDLAKKGFIYFLGVPVQSGSRKVLKAMGRYDNKKGICRLVKRLRKHYGLTLSTSIIVGFPGETEKDFSQTLKFVEDCQFDVVSFQNFSVRQGTRAEGMKNHLSQEVKDRRFNKLQKLADKLRVKRQKYYFMTEMKKAYRSLEEGFK